MARIGMTAERTINYEALAQDAMRSVVRTILIRVAKSGLPGDHHFYISFDTQVPGVGLSKRLKDKYAEEMTIVLQHRFWDLLVSEDRFEVKLTFDGIPERLVVPFAALKVFFDPSVRYGLQFEDRDFDPEATAAHSQVPHAEPMAAAGAKVPAAAHRGGNMAGRLAAPGERKPRSPRKPRVERSAEAPSYPAPAPAFAKPPESGKGTVEESATPVPTPAPTHSAQNEPQSGAQIVSLDSFRKK